MVGVDITESYIEDAKKTAKELGLHNTTFICKDIRGVKFENEFDLVLSLADGAIGYLENEEENLIIFNIVSRALKDGGQYICDIMNAEYADTHFPIKMWDAGTNSISLSEFDWDRKTRILLYGGYDIEYGKPAMAPSIAEGDPTRLYTPAEIQAIFRERGMEMVEAFAGYSNEEASANELQMVVHGRKTRYIPEQMNL